MITGASVVQDRLRHSSELSFIDRFHHSWFQVNIHHKSFRQFRWNGSKGNGAQMIVYILNGFLFRNRHYIRFLPRLREAIFTIWTIQDVSNGARCGSVTKFLPNIRSHNLNDVWHNTLRRSLEPATCVNSNVIIKCCNFAWPESSRLSVYNRAWSGLVFADLKSTLVIKWLKVWLWFHILTNFSDYRFQQVSNSIICHCGKKQQRKGMVDRNILTTWTIVW